ncbi:MAG TPA: ABC transporter permease, partial [Methylomirabilota bacterium]|nr:ABC transporter permease [Methylomirabilota bacterium]
MRLVNARPSRSAALVFGALPILLILAVYVGASNARLAVNPEDKLLPSLAQMADAFWRMATVPERRSGDLLLWIDTAASLG